MRQTAFYYSISAQILLSLSEVEHLQHVSGSHYDGECRRAGRLGGFIYGWRNRFEEGAGPGDAETITASLDELDVVAKILEQPEGNRQLFKEVTEVAERLRAEWGRMNGEERRHFRQQPKRVHRGHMYERIVGDFAQARREHAFAWQWEHENDQYELLAKVLNMHLQTGGMSAPFKAQHWPTQAEATDHATVIQWLGSSVGFAFVEDSLRRAGYVVFTKTGAQESGENMAWRRHAEKVLSQLLEFFRTPEVVKRDGEYHPKFVQAVTLAAGLLKGHELQYTGGAGGWECPDCRMFWPDAQGIADAASCGELRKLDIPDRD